MQNYAYQTDLFNRKKNQFTREYKIYHDGSHYIARESVNGRNRTVTRRGRSALITLFDILYDETIKSDVATDEEKKRYITDKLINDYCVDIPDVDIFVEENFGRKTRNIWQREKRFRRKAYLNRWNYFVTFTYDGKKHTEETFIKRLRKCLANLHTRRGWRYMGVTERGEENGRFCRSHRRGRVIPFSPQPIYSTPPVALSRRAVFCALFTYSRSLHADFL